MIDIALFLSIICAIYGLFEFAHYSYLEGYSFFAFNVQDLPERRIHVTFYNANFYATMLEMFIFCALYRSYTLVSKKAKAYYILISFMNLFMLNLSGCRTAFGAIAFAFLIYFIALGNKKLLHLSWIMFVACLIIFFLNPNLIPRLDDLGSIVYRQEIWEGSIKIIKMFPIFGNGPQTYGLLAPSLGLHIAPHAHNMYLDSLCSYGIVGCIALIMFVKTMIKDIFTLKVNRSAFALTISVLTIVLVHGIMDVTYNYVATGCFILMLLNCHKILEKN